MPSPTDPLPAPEPAPGWLFRVAVIVALGISLSVGAYFYKRIRRATRPPGAPDVVLGVKRVRGVEESGFYNTEGEDTPTPFRWTNGSARLVVPIDGPAPVALHVRLGLGIPKPTRLAILANGTSVFDETVKPQEEWVREVDLPSLPAKSPITLEILSDTFIPSPTKDARTLGVNVRGITLIGADRDYADVNLAAESIPGVEESGFYYRERCDGEPCRWTNGNAKVVVPVPGPGGRRWRALAVMAEIPDRPNYRVRLAVNGRVLFDEAVKGGTLWSKEFALDDLELDRRATIELNTSSIAPNQGTTRDGRTLGIRVRKLMLRGD